MTELTLTAIKIVQWLMLLSALAAFAYGAWHLGDALWLRVAGEVVNGKVIEEGPRVERRSSTTATGLTSRFENVTVYKPTIEYLCPGEPSVSCRVTSPISLEGDDASLFRQGNVVPLRVNRNNPTHARPILSASAYFWPIVGFVVGLAGLLVVGGLFYLHEAAFGRDLSAGISVFRHVRLAHVAAIAVVVAGVLLVLRFTVPWLGHKEFLALATGEIRFLPSLLKAREPRTPGKLLNDAEAAVARLPWLGEGYAGTALELAITTQNREDIDRYLAAYAESPSRFPAHSNRALLNAIAQRDLETFKRLLELGFRPEDALFDPLQAATEAKLPEFVRALGETRKKR
jgi:hypothetical protein